MTSKDFCYWLQGYFELFGKSGFTESGLSAEQTNAIKNHLNMVFKHEIDPSYGDKEHQNELSNIHSESSHLNPGVYSDPTEPKLRC